MGENLGFNGPKAQSNRAKSKGLQKLMWYCQMCEKQCRDANGFKCHRLSESHQRQMQIFGQNQALFIDKYSQEFEDAFLEHMRRCHRFGQVPATLIYNEYISDKHHIHMNGTRWATLTEFVAYLGKTGKCKVEDSARGWLISYNARDSEELFRETQVNKRLKVKLVAEEMQERHISKQIERASKLNSFEIYDEKKAKLQSVVRPDKVGKVAFALTSRAAGGGAERAEGVFKDVESDESWLCRGSLSKTKSDEVRSSLEVLMKEEEEAKERRNRKSYWLCEGIVVKVIDRSSYHNKKGIVRKVVDRYVGEIEVLDTKDVLRIHQDELQTVIPHIGGLVRIVNGAYRGSNARLLAVDVHNFCARLQLDKCVYQGRVLPQVGYEDICKLLVSLPSSSTSAYFDTCTCSAHLFV